MDDKIDPELIVKNLGKDDKLIKNPGEVYKIVRNNYVFDDTILIKCTERQIQDY